mmetsp:Transcript_28987/g.88898  ORF Transcript_28987/g.88898 Transcript_28987/m.88898 type:complete len:433 (+) Transcript_28987:76-1374(+)
MSRSPAHPAHPNQSREASASHWSGRVSPPDVQSKRKSEAGMRLSSPRGGRRCEAAEKLRGDRRSRRRTLLPASITRTCVAATTDMHIHLCLNSASNRSPRCPGWPSRYSMRRRIASGGFVHVPSGKFDARHSVAYLITADRPDAHAQRKLKGMPRKRISRKMSISRDELWEDADMSLRIARCPLQGLTEGAQRLSPGILIFEEFLESLPSAPAAAAAPRPRLLAEPRRMLEPLFNFLRPSAMMSRACVSCASSYARRSPSARWCFSSGVMKTFAWSRLTTSSEAKSCIWSSCAVLPRLGSSSGVSSVMGVSAAISPMYGFPAHEMAYSAAHELSRSCLDAVCEARNSASTLCAPTRMSSTLDGVCSRAIEYMHEAVCSHAAMSLDHSFISERKRPPWIRPFLYSAAALNARNLRARAASNRLAGVPFSRSFR